MSLIIFGRSILGPMLGGALAEPCMNFPTVFPRGTIFDRFPYLLPNLVCAAILACGVVVGILFLEETNEEKKNRRDVGLDAGQWILAKVRWWDSKTEQQSKLKDANLDERRSLIDQDDQPPGYRTTEGSPLLPSSRALSPERATKYDKPPALTKAFTTQVILNIIAYGILA